MDLNVNVKVAVRCRPMSQKETAKNCQNIIEIKEGKTIHIIGSASEHQEDKDFSFDHCYDGASTQPQVYNDLGLPLVNQALEGFNGTIFAYGQTGSGKTFSMMGTEDNRGIIPLLNEDLWVKINQKLSAINDNKAAGTDSKFMVTASFLEVYNEELKDLLNPSDKKLKIHEHSQQGIFVSDLCELIVRDSHDLLKLIYQGNAVRRVASTNMNDQSSRSHSVFTIKLEQKTTTDLGGGLTREQTIKAKLNLVDLAGSERASKTGASGATLKEGANINLSLMTLGNVINALAEGQKKGKKVIPYRNSKLTRLLQESLGGNSATVMIASISPADYNYSETIGTLKYANRAKAIANEVTRNEDSSERMIRDLQAQIEALKHQLEHDAGSKNDPELEMKLKQMEESQSNAWEERERLQRELEAERQHNMNSVISGMMQSVKEQKVQRMKNIKRLTNEKALLSKNYKDFKDMNAALKQDLDKNIQQYQELQKQYDDLMASNEAALEGAMKDGVLTEQSEEAIAQQHRRNEEAETMANEMVQLLTQIENDRLKFTDKRDALKRMRARLEKVDEEITDERAELVATAGLLSQNDKLREQIQEEEREKMKVQLDDEMKRAKEMINKEREDVRGTIEMELKGEMEELKAEIRKYQSLLKVEQSKSDEILERTKQLQEYADNLESRLTDSEVAHEFSQAEVERLNDELRKKEETNQILQHEHSASQKQIADLKHSSSVELERLKEEQHKLIEDAKFDMFKRMMDTFMEERKGLEQRFLESQNLLQQAAKDVNYLTQRNQELTVALNQAIYYEPPIK